jgi:hypothetical protein
MMRLSVLLVLLGCAFVPTGCAPPGRPLPVDVASIPATDPLYRPERVNPGRLEYAPDRSTFAPLLTERFAYPTQPEANDAYRRLLANTPPDRPNPSSLWLFGCKPGALDAQTARVTRYRGPVVHCATDFLGATGRRVGRQTVNLYYDRSAWTMQPVAPPRAVVPWLGRESSPKDRWWWVPGRDRYE